MSASMERIRRLCGHPLFQEQLSLLTEAEKDRIFCRHTMEHFLDVARIMYIYRLEDGCGPEKELIYAAALLHDIGRHEQLLHGTPHHEAGAEIAGRILPECGFSLRETLEVQNAIGAHRPSSEPCSGALADYLRRADKQSRCCFCCPAQDACNWPEDKKNRYIQN